MTSPPRSARDCSCTERMTLSENESMATSAATPSEIDDMYSSSRRRAVRLSRQASPKSCRVAGIGSPNPLCFHVGNDPAVAQADDSLGVIGQTEIVGHENDRRRRFTVQRLEQIDDSCTGVAVEIPGRLVGKRIRAIGEGTRDRDALLLAAGRSCRK